MHFDSLVLAGFGTLCAVVFWWWTDIDVEGQRLEIKVPATCSSFYTFKSWFYREFRKFRYVLRKVNSV